MNKSGPKWFFCLILLIGLVIQIKSYAQSALEKRITIHLVNENLKAALDKISKVGGVKFTYNEQIAQSNLKVNLKVQGKTIKEVLNEIFSGKPYSFTLLDKEIFIRADDSKSKKPEAGPAAIRGSGSGTFTLSGSIKAQKTGETLIAATIKVAGSQKSTLSNEYGFYSLSLPSGSYYVEVGAVGFKKYSAQIDLTANRIFNIDMEEDVNELSTVEITSSGSKRDLDNPQMGMERLSIAETNNIPVLLGERDVIKAIQLLPGVKPSSEGGGGFFVRGGSADQNMILLDEAPVYNATHLVGFFSTFNSDAIKNVTLYKSGMPAQYGGRLSSVLDIKMNDGNNQKFGVSGGVGMISARVNVEGPIQKDKSSFLISARRTYLDMFLKLSGDTNLKNSSLYFYDVNMKANYFLGEKDRLFVSGYLGKDVLESKGVNGIRWGNSTATLRWNHIFNSKLFSNTSLIYSNYDYTIKSDGKGSTLSLFSQIRDFNVKEDLQWYANERNTISVGVNAIYHTIKPGEVRASGDNGYVSQDLQNRYSIESAAYVSNTWKASDALSITYGLRASAFSILGKGDYYQINSDGLVTGTTSYKSGEVVKTYLNLEPRASAALQLNESSSVKASYVRNVQNLHLISNSTSTSPTDRWVASTNIIKPETSDQFSLGYYKNILDNIFDFTAETYYKSLKNQVDYKNGAEIFTNRPIETQLLFGIGRAYGIEFSLKKKTGRLTGWLAYTLSKSERKIDGINNNNWYNARQDKTHDISVVMMYQLNPKWSLSANWVFSTGSAVTFPIGKYKVLDQNYFYYSNRNGDRMPNYHRLDLGATRLLKQTKKFSSELNFSLYNAYGRQNAYEIRFKDNENDPSQTVAEQTSLFRFIPSVSYNFKF
ncbi:TonB-dependent receptor [Pedobacter sp.]|jgi:hypothetical protein|uniref:TonB-dependent receptor n=1 Tax=Pedobacter sp. TaxID=1411316 RepID=UPI002CA62604|nr:TonB-dependent receptor [Pedobacter sp.]HWW38702.1 TonB-dependent receptor [Pedobacter sp.]